MSIYYIRYLNCKKGVSLKKIIYLLFLLFICISSAKSATKNHPFDIYELNGNIDGNTLLVIGGIHGDEPGGYFSSSLLLQHYKIKKGNVIVVPNLNPDSILNFKRGIYKDMNRKFASIAKNDPDYDNVIKIKEIIKRPDVNFVLNLHDGHGFYREKWENSIFNPRAWGQTYVIDQKKIDHVLFGNLDEIAQNIVNRLNKNLHYDFHTFGIRNTETRYKDEEQQNSLTFFAISNLKPALAIETSKNIKDLELKTFYQLSSIEALMDILDIEYERDFTLTPDNVNLKIKEYGEVFVNNNVKIPLDDAKNVINFTPLKRGNNDFLFSHPLGREKSIKNGYEVYVGHILVTTLRPDYFDMTCSFDSMEIVSDNKEVFLAKFGDYVDFKQGFLVKGKNTARVNVIGYSKKGVINESDIFIDSKFIDKNYALNKTSDIFRVEVYEGEHFCGMINLKKDKNAGK